MKYIFGFLTIAILMVGCSGGDASSPKGTMVAFIEASKKGDIEAVKKLISKNDLAMWNSFTQLLGKDSAMIEKKKQEFVEQYKDVTYAVKDEKIDGDKAVVNLEIKDKDSTVSHPFNLVKEDGSWKVSLMSSAFSHNGMNDANINIGDSIKKGLEQMKNINIDSLHGAMKEGLQKLKELEKTDPEAAKRIEEAMKKLGQH